MGYYLNDAKTGARKFYVDDNGNRYRASDGSYTGRRERDGYNTNHLGQRTSYSSNNYTYGMDGRAKGYRSGNTYYYCNGNPKYHKG